MKRFNLDKKAFSLAEMMVVMLIISLVMAAFLPIITKRSKSTQAGNIRHGQRICTTAGTQTPNFTVPLGVTTIWVTAAGGGGGGVYFDDPYGVDLTAKGGNGQVILRQAITVNPGSDLTIFVGAGGNGKTGKNATGDPGVSSTLSLSSPPNTVLVTATRGTGGSITTSGVVTYGASGTRDISLPYGLGGFNETNGSGNGTTGAVIIEW